MYYKSNEYGVRYGDLRLDNDYCALPMTKGAIKPCYTCAQF